MPDRPKLGSLEERAAPDLLATDGKRIRGRIPYGVESVDMGGWREVIEAGALDNANLDGLVATVDHVGVPLGRYPVTLDLEDRSDGLHWSVDPPESRSDIREAVERGDLRAGSWRMVVGRDEWRGDVRHIREMQILRDVCVATHPAYPSAAVELRTLPEETIIMPETPATTEMPAATEAAPAPAPAPIEARSAPEGPGLPVETATASSRRSGSLTDEFRAAGFPGEVATLPFEDVMEDRALVVTAGNPTAALRTSGVPLGADGRWAWPIFPRVGVDAGVTAVDVLRQTARSLATPANVVRAVDAVTAKPETGSTITVESAPLKQVASIQSGVPNVYLESSAVASIIESDLRLAINGGLDKLVIDVIVTAGFQAPGADALLVSIRKAITTIQAAGYNPDTLVLRPADSEALDVLEATATAGDQIYVFGPGERAPGTIFGLTVRVSKSAAAPVVLDSKALGRLYVAPVSLARFEENAGSTNSSTIRLETNALFNVERVAAAVRIAAA